MAAIYVMENYCTVDDYLNMRMHGDKFIKEAEEKIRLQGIKNEQIKAKLWRDSLKVSPITPRALKEINFQMNRWPSG